MELEVLERIIKWPGYPTQIVTVENGKVKTLCTNHFGDRYEFMPKYKRCSENTRANNGQGTERTRAKRLFCCASFSINHATHAICLGSESKSLGKRETELFFFRKLREGRDQIGSLSCRPYSKR